MADELLDFKDTNFDFLKYRTYGMVNEAERNAFLLDCRRVLEQAHKTVLEMCRLGFRLKELKKSSVWQYVLDPETDKPFTYDRFDDFCSYAFGFSKTKTSNFISLTEFVKTDGPSIEFVDEKYLQYNTSQLVELSTVDVRYRKYFTPEMSVSDMRLVKKMIKTGYHAWWTAEEMLKEARSRFCSKNPKPFPTQEDPNVIPGQITVSELNPDQEVFEPEPEVLVIPDPEKAPAPKRESDVGTEPEEKEAKFNIKSRDGRRYWLSHYTEWASEYNRGYYPLFERVYHYNLKNGAVVYAAESHVCIDPEKLTVYESPRYYLKTELYVYPLQMTKDQIDKYILSHLEEL